ncbi:hypothetical protein LEP1GSC036_3307 [Leptospira weilii str. 2006001853]|uniref:Uncharacterized protein n=1 Tax=Leptospira weilii str. 2006001853 TaxID=1001589 RepID=A0A828Z2P6_9LEPT|nr:hypothetical protein LEP1GSC036_3307 [Leptospira weilii str. 2006001853]EMJ67103.1 hypothetical protein LEP1GSC051_3755 [Leptospira sp. P2653]EMN43662.1 hypothetical protein LEP1GSC086_3546 [Leptospira weilii str. LNT 1234]QDK22460.1 hypothetical protein FHG67_06800 [Leptospira weilii]QDK27894.1 hypothetical protein FHG68_15395 [Leptospira weilii]
MLSVLVLVLNCGPICGFDSKISKILETPLSSASCHQESNSEKTSGCEWDSSSIVLSETDSHLFKFLRFFIPLRIDSANPLFSFFPFLARMGFVFDFVENGSNEIRSLSSVRLLI